MGTSKFEESLRKRLTLKTRAPDDMQRRIAWLRGIPFSAIVTTNYDNLLSGPTPCHEAFGETAARILRRRDPLRVAKLAFGDEVNQMCPPASGGNILTAHEDLLQYLAM